MQANDSLAGAYHTRNSNTTHTLHAKQRTQHEREVIERVASGPLSAGRLLRGELTSTRGRPEGRAAQAA